MLTSAFVEDFPVLPGLDVLRAQKSAAERDTLATLIGLRIGLLTNHTGRALDGTPAFDVLRELKLNVTALFSPEHGFTGTREGHIESTHFETLPVFSLYGETRRPTAEMLSHIDILLCDLQDVGARFYTYASTLALCLEECLPRDIAVVVLDRPNPLGGKIIGGPQVDEEHRSFVAHLRVPIQHSMTLGELARLHVSDETLSPNGLRVVPCANWTRDMRWLQTKLSWLAPSPNLPDFDAAAWYPALCLCEFSGVAVGRGTDAPFQIVGAPWMDSRRVLREIENWPDEVKQHVRAQEITFTPTRAIYEGEECRGVRFSSRERNALPYPVEVGLVLLAALHRTHPQEFALEKALPLLGSTKVLKLLRAGESAAALQVARSDAGAFRERCKATLLYSPA